MDKSLEIYEEKNGVITVKSIYGENIYETPIKMINDGERVGVVIRGHEIFLYRDEIRHIIEAEDGLIIVGQSMSIEIRCC